MHFLLSPSDAGQLVRFMQFVNANIAKEVARLHNWPDRVWSRRYRAIPVVDDNAAHARIRYLLSHGAKEGLVSAAGKWPGPNCIAPLTRGDILRGTWFDRSAEYRARAAGKTVKPGDFATTYDIKLTPLACVQYLSTSQQQSHYRRMIGEIDAEAHTNIRDKGRAPMGAKKILAQDPHHRPKAPSRSPAPLVHSHDKEKRSEFLSAYRAFIINFRVAVDSLKATAKQITNLFPDWAFPPAPPFRQALQ